MLDRLLDLLDEVNWRMFSAFLVLGVLSGAFFGGLSASAAPAPKALGGQRNVLIAVVDEASAESTTLQSLWLAAGYADTGEINWIPLYPEPLDQADAGYAAPHAALLVNPTDENVWNGLGLLRQRGVWWDDVIVVDQVALQLVGQLAGISTKSHTPSAEAPQNALYAQVNFLRQFCMNAPALSADGALDKVLLLTAGAVHLRTSMSQFELISLWDQLGRNGFELSCSHPWAE